MWTGRYYVGALEYFARGVTAMSDKDDDANPLAHNMLELVYYDCNRRRLSHFTFVQQSKLNPDKRFKNATVGDGLFACTDFRKGNIMYAILETGVNAQIVPSGGTDNFDLGNGTALAPLQEDCKDEIFMMNHADTGNKYCNAKVQVGYSEFQTRRKTMVFVMLVKVQLVGGGGWC